MTDAAAKIARTAAAVRAAGIPDGLNRWLGMTPAQLEDQNERLQRLLDNARKRKGQPMKAPAAGSKEAQLRDMRSHQIPAAAKPATVKKLAAQIAAAATPQSAATAPAQQETTTMETQTAATAAKAKKSAAPEKAAKAKSKAKKAAKTASKAKKSTAPKAAAAAKTKPAAAKNGDAGVRPGSKVEIVAKLLTRASGCTTKDVLEATGWPSVSMPQQAKAAGLTLKKEKDGAVTRYYGA